MLFAPDTNLQYRLDPQNPCDPRQAVAVPDEAMTPPRVLSVNVGGIRTLEWHGRQVTTGIWKQPVTGRVALHGVNFAGDDQADRTVHGGVHKAVYAYAREDYDFWQEHDGISTPPGLFGDNLTVEGLDLSAAVVGAQWSVGTTVLEVAQPRLPCFKLGLRLNDAGFPKRFLEAARMGAYLRIITEGDVGTGDTVYLTRMPDHGVTLRAMLAAFLDPANAAALRNVPGLPPFWQHIADGH